MVIISLDNALVTTGYSIFKDKELIIHNTFTIPAYKSIEQRLGEFWKKLDDLYREYEFEYLYFEDCQSQGNAQTYHKLSMIKATILLWCYFNEINYSILTPSHWRKILKTAHGQVFGRSRAEQKKSARGFVKDHYNIDVSEDEADAICIGAAGIIEKNSKKSAF